MAGMLTGSGEATRRRTRRNMETPRIVTPSGDDGDRPDLRILQLLRSRGIPGTSYIPISR
jgi:hypothetical protein